MTVPDEMPIGTGEECVDEFDEDAELESGTWNAGTDRVGLNNSGVCGNKLGVVGLRGFEAPES